MDPPRRPAPRLPSPGGGLSAGRRRAGLVAAGLGLPALTGALVPVRGEMALESVLLLYVLGVVLVAVLGGLLPALAAAAGAALLATHYFTEPYGTWDVAHRLDLTALATFLLVAVAVSVTVEVAARTRVTATRDRVEADLLSGFAAGPVREDSLTGVLAQVQSTFGMTSVALLRDVPGPDGEPGEGVLGSVGPPLHGQPVISVEAGEGLRLVAEGPELFAEDRQLLARLAAAAARAWETQGLAGEAARAHELAEIDRLRSALLAAVGHDLRTPLAGIKAAVSSLRQHDIAWSAEDRAEFLAQIESSADRLDDLVANLLAMSRLQAGVLSVDVHPVVLDEVVARALLDVSTDEVEVRVPDDLPLALTDGGLLERVVANLADNARRFAPTGVPVQVVASADATSGSLRLRVSDHGPGVPRERWEQMFAPFQRLDDRGGGVGLGLAIARGFTEAAGGTLIPSETEGGGLTMTVLLPAAPTVAPETGSNVAPCQTVPIDHAEVDRS